MEPIEMAGYTQTQYHPKTFSNLRSNGWEGLQQFHHPGHNFAGNSFGIIHPKFGERGAGAEAQILNGAVFSEPESELTYNGSCSRKRNRDNQMVAAMKAQHHHHHRRQQQIHLDASQNIESCSEPASTSGRLQEIGSYLYNQDVELEAFIRLQNQNLCSVIEESWKKHCRWVMLMIEQQTQKKLQEKESELEKLHRLNAELEEKIKQMIAESQMWFNIAKNGEETVSALRLSLERVLIQNTVEGFGETDGDDDDDGDGDGDGESCSGQKRDGVVEPPCRRGKLEVGNGKSCKACGGAEVSVIVLPCRHLCVCMECENSIDWCPVCHTVKVATLQVYVS